MPAGHLPPTPARRRPAPGAPIAALVAVAVIGVAGAGTLLGGASNGDGDAALVAATASEADATPRPESPAAGARGEDGPLIRTPALRLEQPIDEVLAALGDPADAQPDLYGTAHGWRFDGGELWVTAADEDGAVVGWWARANPGAALALHGDVELVLGQDTINDVLVRWGAPAGAAADPHEVETLVYESCLDAWPVVTKMGQDGAGRPDADRVVVLVLHGYVDIDPALTDCPA